MGIDFQAQVPGGRVGVSAKVFDLLLDMEAGRRHLAGHEAVMNPLAGSEPLDGLLPDQSLSVEQASKLLSRCRWRSTITFR
jgi:hypothetical protein